MACSCAQDCTYGSSYSVCVIDVLIFPYSLPAATAAPLETTAAPALLAPASAAPAPTTNLVIVG